MPTAKKRARVSVDLSKLNLPGPGAAGAWVSAPAMRESDRTAAIQQLRDSGLGDEAVRALLLRLESGYTDHNIRKEWPTVGEERQVLRAAAELASALGEVFTQASPRAQAEITAAARLAAIDDQGGTASDMGHHLERVAIVLRMRVGSMPPQGRRRPRIDIVRALVEVAGAALPAPTTREGSVFYVACCAAFVLAGYPSAPDRAIEQYIRGSGR